MIGLLGDPEQIARLELLSRVPTSHLLHKEEGFAALTTAPPPGVDEGVQWSDIVTDSRHVLAFEGYVCASNKSGPSRPARWLLEQYTQKGLAAFGNLHGAYVFCLFDRRAQQAWMGTCAFGRRDLYYMREKRGTLFATDLAQLLELSVRRPSLAADQLSDAFLCGAVYGGNTLLAGVRRALPGAILSATASFIEEGTPGPLPQFVGAVPTNEEEAIEELDCRLRTAVRRLVGVREKTAVLMSSGVDSPLAAAYVKLTTGKVQAITLKMPWPPDESPDAAKIARALGASHHLCQPQLHDLDLLADLDGFVRVMEEPTSFGLGLLMMSLSRHARTLADGFFCGVSADALFGNPTASPDDPNTDSIFHYLYREISPENARMVVRLDGADPCRVVRHLRTQLTSDTEHLGRRLPFFLQSGLMIRTAARMARFHDAEALFPYLDRDVVALAMHMPRHLLGAGKSLLKKLAALHYTAGPPQERKVPFTAYPISRLMAAGLLDPMLDLLDEKRTRERGVYRLRKLRRLIDSYRERNPEPGWHLIMWQLIVFELFCRRFVDNQPAVTIPAKHPLRARRLALETVN